MKNVKESRPFAAFMLTSCDYTDEVRQLAGDLIRTEDKTTPDYAQKKLELLSKLTTEAKGQLKSFGAECPHDTVQVAMDLGTFLFDMYKASTKPTPTPLGQMIYQKKLQDLAQTFSQDDFDIPDHAVAPIRSALLDEKVWASAIVSSWVDIAQEGSEARRVSFTMSSAGAMYFSEIVKSATESVYNSEFL